MEMWSTLNTDQQLTVFLAFFSAVLGGAISICAAFLSLSFTARNAEKRRAMIQSEQDAFCAQRGFIKLFQYANAAFSAKRAIDNQFDEAAEAGNAEMEPVQKVQEIIGSEEGFEKFSADELVFLLHSKDADLLGELIVFEKRVLGQMQVIRSYNEKRSELFELISEGITGGGGPDGTVVSMELEGKGAILANAQIAALNNVLGVFMYQLERETEDSKRLLARYSEAAKRRYGELFPSLKFEANL